MEPRALRAMNRKASLASPTRPAVAARASRMNATFKAMVAACGMFIVIACGGNSGGQGDESSERLGSDESAAVGDRSSARGPSGASGSVPIDITAELGGKAYRLRGDGQCTYAEQASIRGVPSSMWQVQYRGRDEGITQTSVTVWRPDGGGVDQVAVSMQVEARHHQINTVVGSERAGSGAVLLRPQGDGIRLELDGRDETGTALRLTIACARLIPAVTDGG